jgi:hemerythrin superfamily protein
MAVLELLAEQHKDALELLARIRAATGNGRIPLMGELAEALTLHTALEERFLYPLLKEHGLGELADRSLNEHAEVRRLVSQMLGLKRNDPRLEQVFLELDHSVRAHMEEEEKEIFPKVREVVDEAALAAIQGDMQEALGRLQDAELLELAEQEPA